MDNKLCSQLRAMRYNTVAGLTMLCISARALNEHEGQVQKEIGGQKVL